MNRRLSESRIRATCRELLGNKGRVSGRALCAELRTRFGAVGKTERVFGIWREELAQKAQRATLAKGPAEPAELAEIREQAHQEKWGMEVDRLRQRLRAQDTTEAEMRRLQDRVLQLSRELMGYRQ